MAKTVLITGSTDGIGLETAKRLVAAGHRVLLHGRNPGRLEAAKAAIATLPDSPPVVGYVADLSRLADVETLADEVVGQEASLDVLINNAGVFRTSTIITEDGLDVRFAVNTIAPYLLTQRLMTRLGRGGRVVNLSSAAQAPVDLEALAGTVRLPNDMGAYAQSKLALTMWSRHLALTLGEAGPVIVAVNPGSLLATKMVQQGFGVAGSDVGVGADILLRAASSPDFATASGKYFDNDSGRFTSPHTDALEPAKTAEVVEVMETVLASVRR